MQTQQFSRKPFYVDAVRVTPENMEEVAGWCKGTLVQEVVDGTLKQYIKVDVRNPQTENQTRARVGDWVLIAGNSGFKVYTNKAFEMTFVAVPVPTAPEVPKPTPPKRPEGSVTLLGPEGELDVTVSRG